MHVRRQKKVLVLGFMFREPVGGVVWQTLHYLLGLRRLGFDCYYLECHGHWVPDPAGNPAARALERFGLAERWSCQSSTGERFGLGYPEVLRVCAGAEAVLNLSGSHALHERDFLCRCPRRVYVETDPVVSQLRLSEGDAFSHQLLGAHTHHFSFGENLGLPDCPVPTAGYAYRPTRQPVVLDCWAGAPGPAGDAFTTIGQWKQRQRGRIFRGETYHWSKHLELLKFLDLPRRTGQPLELALGKIDEEDRSLLRAHGWRVADAAAVSSTPEGYRDYILRSRGEFTVAKDQNVRLRSGWFSDRSACYLAAGKPVVTQDTAFGRTLPTGEGLFAFRTPDEILSALGAINADYPRHCRAAREIAAEYFDAEKVLRSLLDSIGL